MTYRVPLDVGYVIEEDAEHVQVFVMRLPDGVPIVLEGPAGVIWRSAIASNNFLESVAETFGETPHSIAADVMRFVNDLVAKGLLELDA